jgi:PERQ amino acid-rich with GYF domain-containing protein
VLGFISLIIIKQDDIWAPAPAINPSEGRSQANTNNQNNSALDEDAKLSKKRKKRMQKVDQKFLGFTVHAAPDRINIGEIENTKVE